MPRRLIKVRWLRHSHILQEILILWRRLPRPMRRLVMTHHEERLVDIPLVQKLQRKVCNQIRAITGVLLPSALFNKHRVIISPLPRQNPPMIEPLRLPTQVPLPDHRRLIPILLQILRHTPALRVERLRQRLHPILMAILPRQNRSPRRSTNRIRTKAILQPHSLARNPVDIRRLIDLAPISGNRMRRMVIRHHKQDVRPRMLLHHPRQQAPS